MNPLGMVDALTCAMNHAATQTGGKVEQDVKIFTSLLTKAMHNTFRYGQGTRDMEGPSGLTTEEFVDKVARRLGRYVAAMVEEEDESTIGVGEPERKYSHTCKLNSFFLMNYIMI